MTALMCLIGCGQEAQVSQSRPQADQETLALMQELGGQWSVRAVVFNTCPASWAYPFPQGETAWTTREGRLKITSRTHAGSLELWPAEDWRLTREVSASYGPCSGRQSLELVVEEYGGAWLRGVFVSKVGYDGGAQCDAAAQREGIAADGCETRVEWMAIRH